jgi:hypothetical protein
MKGKLNNITPEQMQEMAKTMDAREISELLGVGNTSVYRYFKKHGIKTRLELAQAILDSKEEMARLCEEHSAEEIMEILKVSSGHVYNHLRKHGLEPQKKYVAGENHYRWKGGKYVKTDRGGYMVKVDDPNYKYQYRPEHCVIMENYIGRKMEPDEVVHHVDGNPYNNDISNLLLLRKLVHDRFHLLLGSLQIDHRNLTKEQTIKIIESFDKIRDYVRSLAD